MVVAQLQKAFEPPGRMLGSRAAVAVREEEDQAWEGGREGMNEGYEQGREGGKEGGREGGRGLPVCRSHLASLPEMRVSTTSGLAKEGGREGGRGVPVCRSHLLSLPEMRVSMTSWALFAKSAN